MQNLMIRDNQGKRRDLGNPRKARDWAARELSMSKDEVVFMTVFSADGGHDVFWCSPAESEYFQSVLKAEGDEILHVGRGADIGPKR